MMERLLSDDCRQASSARTLAIDHHFTHPKERKTSVDFSNVTAKIYELLTVYGMRVVAAIAILVIGRWIAMSVRNLISRLMTKNRVDETLNKFVTSLSYVALLAFVVVAAVNQLGIQTTSFVAILGAAGLAVGLALQGSLSNFAAGVLMILFKPFKVGDFIEGGGATGVVDEIQIFTTQISTVENKTVIVPNSKMMSDNIINYSAKGLLRVDLVFGIGYGEDIDKARQVIQQVAISDARVLKDPAPVVLVSELSPSSVKMTLRAWSNASDYWGVYFDTIETVKKRFDAEGIRIPYPQQDVHMYQH
jgi:small conductance mechanosensitive channel